MTKSYTFEALGLLHGRADKSLLNIVTMASRMLRVPMSSVSVLDAPSDRQYVAAVGGSMADVADPAGIPMESSICKYVQASRRTLAIPDLLEDPRTSDNAIVKAIGLRSYIGSPIHALTGKIVGTVCCAALEPRTWTADEIAILEHLASCVDDVVRLRALEREDRLRSAQQRCERARRAGYIAHLGHEIRTPLTGIVAATRMLDQATDRAQTQRLVGILDRSASKLLHFVSDVMDLADVDGEVTAVVNEILSLPEMARDLLADLRPVADAKSIALIIDDRIGHVLHKGDKDGLLVILRKLLDNAIKFTDRGSVTLRLQEDAYGQILIDVKDTGKGIAPEFHASIFEEFEDTNPNSARPNGGTGLGMAIVRRMVERMDGTISLCSTPGHGAVFSLSLPLEPVAELVSAE